MSEKYLKLLSDLRNKEWLRAKMKTKSGHLEIIQSVNTVVSKSTDPKVFTTGMTVCRKLGEVEMAKNIERKMKQNNVDHDVFSLTALMHIYASEGDVINTRKAFQMCKRMTKPFRGSNHEYRNPHTFSALITSYVKANDLEGAIDAYHEAVDTLRRPTIDLIDDVLWAFTSFKDAHKFVMSETHTHRLTPTEQTCRALLHSCIYDGDESGMEQVRRHMQSEGFPETMRIKSMLMAIHRRAGNPILALQIFKDVKKPSPYVIKEFIKNCAFIPNTDLVVSARQYYDSAMKEPTGITTSLTMAMVDLYTANNMLDEARTLSQQTGIPRIKLRSI
eukprot:TRINITY_DN12911_c1_g1_i2.p1 TRINITY_DN12911_c1_g1~~TRINITY_DN12911_c1_g1_i2.p1  ORF type:complete len:332 (+),score=47.72 TRINITY_DN12911_c1_g1_i2:120-1115(+)